MSGIKPVRSAPNGNLSDQKEFNRQTANAIRLIYQGKINASRDGVTLTANSDTTTVNDPAISYYSFLWFMPQTANAVVSLPTIYVPQATQIDGQAVLHHLKNAQTDRSYRMLIIG
jgi:hypothetical protein